MREILHTSYDDGYFDEFSLIYQEVRIVSNEISVDSWCPIEKWNCSPTGIDGWHINSLESCRVFRSQTCKLISCISTSCSNSICIKLPLKFRDLWLSGEEWRFGDTADKEIIVTAPTITS